MWKWQNEKCVKFPGAVTVQEWTSPAFPLAFTPSTPPGGVPLLWNGPTGAVKVKNAVLRAGECCCEQISLKPARIFPKHCDVARDPHPAPGPGVPLSERRQISPGPPLRPATLAWGRCLECTSSRFEWTCICALASASNLYMVRM